MNTVVLVKSDDEVEELDEVDGKFMPLRDADGISGMKLRRPSKMFVIVLSILRVIPENNYYIIPTHK